MEDEGETEEENVDAECLFFPLGFVTTVLNFSSEFLVLVEASKLLHKFIIKKKSCRRLALGHFAMARWESKIKDTLIAYFCTITYKDDFKKVENLCAGRIL